MRAGTTAPDEPASLLERQLPIEYAKRLCLAAVAAADGCRSTGLATTPANADDPSRGHPGVGGVVRPQTLPGGPHRRGVRWTPCGSDWVVRACLLGWSEPGNKPRAVTPGGRPDDAPARGDQHPARIGDRQGPQMHLLAEAQRPPSVHPADLRLALPGVPRPRPAVLQPRRPAVPGARHRAAGSGAGPAVVGQGDGQAPQCAGRSVAMALTAGRPAAGSSSAGATR
jgi:hypothetical protein